MFHLPKNINSKEKAQSVVGQEMKNGEKKIFLILTTSSVSLMGISLTEVAEYFLYGAEEG